MELITDFSEAISKIEGLFSKEVNAIIDGEDNDNIAENIYKMALYGKVLDFNFIASKKFDNVLNNLINTVNTLRRDEVFVVLIIFAKTILDTLSLIKNKDNETTFVNVTDMFHKILTIFSNQYEIPNLSTVETNCVICGKAMHVEKGKECFANICKECKGE